MALSLFRDAFEDPIFGAQMNWPIMRSTFTAENNLLGAVDIKETDKETLFTVDTPGMGPNDVHVNLGEGNVLTINGERKREWEEKDKDAKYHRVERSYGKFTRSFRLPETADTEKINAAFDNGVLHVTVPKKPQPEKKEPTRIPISERK